MDFDLSTLIYIIAIIFYFIYSNFLNKDKPRQPQEPVEPSEKPQRTVSFDELLKEIRRDQEERERDLEGAAIPEEDYAEEIYERESPTVQRKYFSYEDPEQFPIPEKVYSSPYKSFEKEPLVKLDDQIDLNADTKILGDVEDVSGYVKRRNRYAEILKNPESIKDAVVVSEILQRKRF
ncbi:MAG TPA: hypothetical protein VK014_01260 [Cyclobacteriaceae bacterium]|nr:hypothetical protein [Cyclobacteriaceae bacterium]